MPVLPVERSGWRHARPRAHILGTGPVAKCKGKSDEYLAAKAKLESKVRRVRGAARQGEGGHLHEAERDDERQGDGAGGVGRWAQSL